MTLCAGAAGPRSAVAAMQTGVEAAGRRRHQSRSSNETSTHTKHLDGLCRVGRVLYGKGEQKHSCTKNEKQKNASAAFPGGLMSLTQEELLKSKTPDARVLCKEQEHRSQPGKFRRL